MFARPHEIRVWEKGLSKPCWTMRERVEALQLSVVSENEAARRLYGSLGFAEYGLEKRALKQDGRYYDEVLMVKFLEQNST
jgi:RimJ/RimL family protein N-acetyltransferase